MKSSIHLFAVKAVGVIALFALATAGPALADSVTINPSIDSWAAPGGGKDNNHYDDIILSVKNNGPTHRTYLKFDLNDAGIPAGSTIDGASLKMYVTTAPSAASTYNLATSTNTTWDNDTASLQDDVPPNVVVASASVGKASAESDITWSSDPLKTAVYNAIAGNISFVVLDSEESGSGRTTLFASNQTTLDPAIQYAPRLLIDYTPPNGECTEGTISITRNEYTGQNPIPWADAAAEQAFEIEFTVEAGCKPLTDVKVQGGMASNTNTYIYSVDVTEGSYTTRSVGRNNYIFTWTIPTLSAGQSESIMIPVSANLNPRGNPSCGVKNLTGEWSASGYWEDDDALINEAKDEVGKFIVDITCP